MHRSEIRIEDVLLEYDGPQIVTARDFYGAAFLCVAIPDPDDSHRFFGSRISEDRYGLFLDGRIDLRYAVSGDRKPKLLTFSYSDEHDTVRFKRIGVIPKSWLPERGFFWENDTKIAPVAIREQKVEIKIDGRWDIEDLADYPQVLAAPYAFLHAVMRGIAGESARLGRTFQRYPWRGGYSTVNFYKELYDSIPSVERVVVTKIAYSSPGTIVLRAAPDVIAALHREIETFSTARSYELYQELRRQMSSRQLLGRTRVEANVNDDVESMLRDGCIELANAISFNHVDGLYRLCGNSWFLAAKLFLAYYRRLLELSDFYRSGKAQYAGPVAHD